MSFSTDEDVLCGCGNEFRAELWSSIDAKNEPALREEVLAGQLNVVTCSFCKSFLYVERFLLYHDADAELMAFVYPKADEAHKEERERKTVVDFAKAQADTEGMGPLPYGPVSLFGVEALAELLRREQEEADQGAILEALAGSLSLDVVRLRPSFARGKGVPPLLPAGRSAKADPGERLREGLRTLLAANDRLTVYAELSERVAGKQVEVSEIQNQLSADARLKEK